MKHGISRSAFLAIAMILTAGITGLFAQDAATDPSADFSSMTNASFYLQQAQTCFLSAQQKFEIGEYDESTDLANKARDFAEMYRKAFRLKYQYQQSMKLIAEAEALIEEARKLKAAEADLQPSLEKLDEAREQFGRRNYEASVFAATESINLTRDLLNRLRDNSARTEQTGDWKTYTVRLIPDRRDCLWRIAEYKFHYGDPWKWPMIWKANKDQIVDPDLIFPGQVFKIPPLNGTDPR
jgi:hypothetical protein